MSRHAGATRDDTKFDGAIPCLFILAQREGNKPKLDDAVPLPPLALSIVEEAVSRTDKYFGIEEQPGEFYQQLRYARRKHVKLFAPP